MNTAPLAFTLATGLVVFGLFTAWFQFRGMAALRARSHVPSDEHAYLRGRHRRRLVTGCLLVLIGLLIAGAYLSGLELRIDRLTEKPPDAAPVDPPADPNTPRQMTPEQKTLVKVWGAYWTAVIVLVFVLLGFALADTLATRRYALQQYKVIREDHEAKLRRDLAMHKAQQAARRAGRGGGSADDPATGD